MSDKEGIKKIKMHIKNNNFLEVLWKKGKYVEVDLSDDNENFEKVFKQEGYIDSPWIKIYEKMIKIEWQRIEKGWIVNDYILEQLISDDGGKTWKKEILNIKKENFYEIIIFRNFRDNF